MTSGALPTQMWLYHVGPQWAKRLLLTGDTITGAEAAQIGLALKAVPADDLAAEVDQLLARLALIDVELLSANKRIVNVGLELMGARTLQRMAAENDARAHQAPSAGAFRERVKERGLREALRERDAKFGDGRARVNGPERRDAAGPPAGGLAPRPPDRVSRPAGCSRSWNFWILPDGVLGISATTSSRSGQNWRAMPWRSSQAVSSGSVGATSPSTTTTAQARSPRRSSG